MVDAEHALQEFRESVSPVWFLEEHYEREKAANIARAQYEMHLALDHDDKRYRPNVSRNFDTILCLLLSPNKVLH